MNVTFVKVKIEEAGKATAVCVDGSISDLMIHSVNGEYRVKKYSNYNWTKVETFDTLAKAKKFCKNFQF